MQVSALGSAQWSVLQFVNFALASRFAQQHGMRASIWVAAVATPLSMVALPFARRLEFERNFFEVLKHRIQSEIQQL